MADPVIDPSSAVWIALIGAGSLFAGQVLQMIQARQAAKASAERAVTAAVKVEAVKEELKVATAATTEKLGEIHTMVNGAHGEALRAGATAARGLYKLDPTTEHKRLMDLAINKLAEHEEREAMVRDDKAGGHLYTHTSYMGNE